MYLYFHKLFYYKMYTKLVFKLDFTKIDILVFLFFILMHHCTFPFRPLWRSLIITVIYFQKYLSSRYLHTLNIKCKSSSSR